MSFRRFSYGLVHFYALFHMKETSFALDGQKRFYLAIISRIHYNMFYRLETGRNEHGHDT